MDACGMFGRFANVAARVALVAGLAACATPTKPLAPEAAGQLHKIALLEIQEPPDYGVANLYLEGVFGGGIVNILHGKQFTEVLRQRGFSISKEVADRLQVALTAAGFDVDRVKASRKPYQAGVISHEATTADAILNVNVGAGYISAHGVDDFIPAVGVRAELIENRSGQESRLYLQSFSYGYKRPLSSAIQIDAPPMYSYGTFVKLLEDNVEAGEGLLKGADLISDLLAKDIASAKH